MLIVCNLYFVSVELKDTENCEMPRRERAAKRGVREDEM